MAEVRVQGYPQSGGVKWYQNVGDFVNIVKAFIGTNYQAIAFGFKQSGVAFGFGGVILIAALTDHCIGLLVKSKHILISKITTEEAEKCHLNSHEISSLRKRLERTISYGDIGRHVFGNCCFHLIQIAVWFTQYTTVIAYFIFIGNTIYKMIPQELPFANMTNVTEFHSRSDFIAQGVPFLAIENVGREVRDVSLWDSTGYSLYDVNISSTPDPYVTISNFTDLANVTATTLKELTTATLYSSTADVTTDAAVSTVEPENVTGEVTTPVTTENSTNATNPTFPTIHQVPGVDMRFLILVPLPFFLLTSLLRRIRGIAVFSTIATLALFLGAVAILIIMLVDFHINDEGFEWVRFVTLPIFIGQLTSAFEGIGCIIPIESSMDGNRHLFRPFLHLAVAVVAVILCLYGTLGYLLYGQHVEQLIVKNVSDGGVLSDMLDVTLIISVLFTYPLQCFPVIEIIENYAFNSKSGCCKSSEPRLEYDEIDGGPSLNPTEEQGLLATASIDTTASELAAVIPPSVPAWKRNVLRVLVTLSVCGFSVILRDAYAYLAAFAGALGCSLLAFILPCMIHIQVMGENLSLFSLIKNVSIIVFAVVSSLLALSVISYKMATGQLDM